MPIVNNDLPLLAGYLYPRLSDVQARMRRSSEQQLLWFAWRGTPQEQRLAEKEIVRREGGSR